MKTTRDCYALILLNGSPDGLPIVMETLLESTRRELEERAEKLKFEYGETMVVKLPVLVTTEIHYGGIELPWGEFGRNTTTEPGDD